LEDDFSVMTSTSAESALNLLQNEQVVVIIADQRMPGLTGDEFLAKAKDLSEATRILVTGYADINALVRAVNHGQIYTYVAKPWEPAQLRVAVIKAAEHCMLMQQVERERELLHALMNNLPDAIWFKDVEGRFTRVNHAAANAMGASGPDAMVGKTIFDFFPPEQAKGIHAQEQLILRSGLPEINVIQELEFRTRGKRWISTTRAPIQERSGGASALVGVSRDVTGQKQAERALQQSEEKYRRMVETAAEGVWIFDDLLHTTFVNSRMAAMLGLKPDDMIGRPVSDFMPAEEAGNQLVHFAPVDSIERSATLRLKKLDGKTVWAILSSSPMLDQNGRRTGTLAMLTDITERKELEDQLRQTQKLEAIGRFAGGVAHDFNNILTVISGHSQLLLRRLDPGNPARSQVEKISAASEQAAGLTKQLLSFSRRRPVEKRQLDLNTSVSNFEKLCGPILGESVELTLRLDEQPVMVEADAGQIDQVLMNLVVNARDAMPRGGELTIDTATVTRMETGGHPGGRFAVLSVTDTGCGMDDATQARIFEPFFTTKEEGKGTGLGLSTVHGIVSQHGGWIDVTSQPGHGTSFGIYLPAIAGDLQVVALPQLGDELPKGNETVLVVDDRAALRELVRETLSECGYQVLEASDGEEGLQVLEQESKRISIVITDVVMPRLSGADFGRIINQRWPQIKVLYMSAYSGETAALDRSAILLQKPFTPETLARKVREVLGNASPPRTILVADDDAEVRSLLHSVLESEGYRVRTVSNGKEAVAAVRESPVGIILTDLAMPEQDGIEMMTEIRKDYPDVKIVAMSGTFAGPVLETAKYLGANAVLPKPINIESLVNLLNSLN